MHHSRRQCGTAPVWSPIGTGAGKARLPMGLLHSESRGPTSLVLQPSTQGREQLMQIARRAIRVQSGLGLAQCTKPVDARHSNKVLSIIQSEQSWVPAANGHSKRARRPLEP